MKPVSNLLTLHSSAAYIENHHLRSVMLNLVCLVPGYSFAIITVLYQYHAPYVIFMDYLAVSVCVLSANHINSPLRRNFRSFPLHSCLSNPVIINFRIYSALLLHVLRTRAFIRLYLLVTVRRFCPHNFHQHKTHFIKRMLYWRIKHRVRQELYNA